MQQGPIAPRALPRFVATPGLAATVSSSADFPGFTGYTPDLLHRLLDGTRTVSPVARHALVTVLPLTTPPEWQTASSARGLSCCLRPEREGSASGIIFLSRPPLGSLALRPGNSLAIPRMAWSVGFIRFVSSTDATQATKVLTFPPVGLSPTEHASLSWTHSFAKTAPTFIGTRHSGRRFDAQLYESGWHWMGRRLAPNVGGFSETGCATRADGVGVESACAARAAVYAA